MNRVARLRQKILNLPDELRNNVRALLDPAAGNMANTIVAFWQESVLRGGPGDLQRRVDAIVHDIQEALDETTEAERLQWLSHSQDVVFCGTYGGATSYVSNFLSALPGFNLGHEKIYRNEELLLRSALAGFTNGDISGAAWLYVDKLTPPHEGGPKVVQVLRNPLHACGSMMNNVSHAIPKTFFECARYWYDHHIACERVKNRYVIRIEDWPKYVRDLLRFLGLNPDQDLAPCWERVDGRRNERGGNRPWTWADLPEPVQELAESYGYHP